MTRPRSIGITLASLMLVNFFGMSGNGGADTSKKNATQATWIQVAAQLKRALDAKPAEGTANFVPAKPVSTKYYYITKTQAEVATNHTKVGDDQHRKDLLRADFATPAGTNIINVNMICSGPGGGASCAHTFPCDPTTCGHANVENHGNSAVWWGVTDDGSENTYAFSVQYQ